MKTVVGIYIGYPPIRVGEMHFVADRGKEASSFAYDDTWLARSGRFPIDPYLPLGPGHAQPGAGSVFFGCFADSEPDGWGRMVIKRDRAIRKVAAVGSSLDYLLEVHDESRVGALRFSIDSGATFLADPGPDSRTAPPLIALKDLLRAANAIEKRTDTARDLRLLLDRGSPLGGMRPKCTIMDDDGHLAIGKFPSATDERDVVRGEVLALQLAANAGIDAAAARVVLAAGKAVAVIRRFDRAGKARLMFSSARTFLGVRNTEDHTYLEFADALRANGAQPQRDIEELWRRIVFSVLITNVDDHLNNHGFLHAAAGGEWRLAPAFDVNPAPMKGRVLKTWITEAGPEASIGLAMTALKPMGISKARGEEILRKVLETVSTWRKHGKALGMKAAELEAFEPAFEHEETAAARAIVTR